MSHYLDIISTKNNLSIEICQNNTYNKAWNLLNALGINKKVCYISWQDANNVKIEKWSFQVIFPE